MSGDVWWWVVVSAKAGGEGPRLDWQVVMEECLQLGGATK